MAWMIPFSKIVSLHIGVVSWMVGVSHQRHTRVIISIFFSSHDSNTKRDVTNAHFIIYIRINTYFEGKQPKLMWWNWIFLIVARIWKRALFALDKCFTIFKPRNYTLFPSNDHSYQYELISFFFVLYSLGFFSPIFHGTEITQHP